VLEGAAVWGGCDNVHSRYDEAAKVFSVIVECDSNPMMLLEAGMTLGFLARAREEQSDNLRNIFGATWTALHDAEGNLIESTL